MSTVEKNAKSRWVLFMIPAGFPNAYNPVTTPAGRGQETIEKGGSSGSIWSRLVNTVYHLCCCHIPRGDDHTESDEYTLPSTLGEPNTQFAFRTQNEAFIRLNTPQNVEIVTDQGHQKPLFSENVCQF